MFCIVAFIVLSLLGVFSTTHRELAREALDCVFRRVTFRPCTTGFDQKIKAKILGKVISQSEGLARFINKNFELLSWTFFLLILVSSFYAIRGSYYYYLYGSCNGLNQTSICVFDPKGEHNKISITDLSCNVQESASANLTLEEVDLSIFPIRNSEVSDQIVFIGCYECDYSRKIYADIQRLVRENNVSYIFAHYPTKEGTMYLSELGNCIFQQDPEKYWQFNDLLFASEFDQLEDETYINQQLLSLGVDEMSLQACLFNPQTKMLVQNQIHELEKTKMYGTPTIFINGKPLVGPKPYRVYAIMLNGFFYWLK